MMRKYFKKSSIMGRYRKGFTLIELLVVIAIIALLMSILMPALRKVREQGKRAVCSSHMKNMITGIHVYASDYDSEIPPSIGGMNASWSFICWQNYEDPPGWTMLGHLYGTRTIPDPEIFFCPSQKNELLSRKDGMGWDWESQTGNEARAISYHYGLLAEIRADTSLELESTKIYALKDRALVCDAFVPVGVEPVWSHPKGLVTGFGDGHIDFIEISKEVQDLSEDMEEMERDDMDLFTAALFELLRGRDDVMELNFPSVSD
jgi:prepilin-type N-terminal cleavage/methylation domain-containing protein